MASLSVRDLAVVFGSVVAVDHLSFDLEPAVLTGLIGPNGAGKTTVLDACTGFVPASGEVLLGEQPLTGMAAHRRARLGLVRTFQSLDLLDDLTVAENVASGMAARRHAGRRFGMFRTENGTGDPVVTRALDLVGQRGAATALPTELSQGQRALVALARALAGEPDVLLLDEPAAGLDTVESRELGTILTALVEQTGISCLLVEHDMGLVLSTCHDVVVIDNGALLARGAPGAISRDPRVIDAYLGVPAGAEA